jgi:Flp pilus assembly protein TadG
MGCAFLFMIKGLPMQSLFSALLRLKHRLAQDRRGASVVLFAAALVPTLAATGAAVDLGYAALVKSRLSSAVDTAALAGARAYFDTDAEAQARSYFDSNLRASENGITVTDYDADKDEENGRLSFTVEASAKVQTVFMRAFGKREVEVSARAKAVREQTGLEMVLALDNTGSMQIDSGGQPRIVSLRHATIDLLDILYGGNDTNPNLRIGILPYTSFVNIGGLLQAEQTATGERYLETLAGYDFDPADRWKWKGCVDAFPTDNRIDSSTNTNNDGAFATAWDTRDFVPGQGANPRVRPAMYPSFDRMETRMVGGVNCGNEPRRWIDGYWVDEQVIPGYWDAGGCDVTWIEGERIETNCRPRTWVPERVVPRHYVDGRWVGRDPNCVDTPGTPVLVETYDFGYNLRPGQYNDPRFPAPQSTWQNPNPYPYPGYGGLAPGITVGGWHSPNMYCPAEALLPTPRDKRDLRRYVNQELNAYMPAWGTYSNVALEWAWRMLTPGRPFQGLPNTSSIPKVIVLMTDGYLYVPFDEQYARSPYGFHHPHYEDPNLAPAGSNKARMEEGLTKRLERLCAVAKRDGIAIYTVTFGMPGNDPRKDLYRNCATAPRMYFDALNGDDLRDAFEEIATDLTALRLAE